MRWGWREEGGRGVSRQSKMSELRVFVGTWTVECFTEQPQMLELGMFYRISDPISSPGPRVVSTCCIFEVKLVTLNYRLGETGLTTVDTEVFQELSGSNPFTFFFFFLPTFSTALIV